MSSLRRFTARFDSDCFSCGDLMFEDDSIAYLPGDDKPSCQDCCDDYDDEEAQL